MTQPEKTEPQTETDFARAFREAEARGKVSTGERNHSNGRGSSHPSFDPALARKPLVEFRRREAEKEAMGVAAQNVGEQITQAVNQGTTGNHKVNREIHRQWRPILSAIKDGKLDTDEATAILEQFTQRLALPGNGSIDMLQYSYLNNLRRSGFDATGIPVMPTEIEYIMAVFEQVSELGSKERYSYHSYIRAQAAEPFPGGLRITKLTAKFLQANI